MARIQGARSKQSEGEKSLSKCLSSGHLRTAGSLLITVFYSRYNRKRCVFSLRQKMYRLSAFLMSLGSSFQHSKQHCLLLLQGIWVPGCVSTYTYLQQVRMCLRVARVEHSGKDGFWCSQCCRFLGEGRTSLVALSRNLILLASIKLWPQQKSCTGLHSCLYNLSIIHLPAGCFCGTAVKQKDQKMLCLCFIIFSPRWTREVTIITKVGMDNI